MKAENSFPILGTSPKEYVPYDIVEAHEAQAYKNHYQSVETLARRGGLTYTELLAVLEDRKCERDENPNAKAKVLDIICGREWIVPVTWEACGFIKVRAMSAEAACTMVHENPDDYPLPYQSEYVDASFDISGGIEESAAMSEIYTKDYESGKWGSDMIFKERGE